MKIETYRVRRSVSEFAPPLKRANVRLARIPAALDPARGI